MKNLAPDIDKIKLKQLKGLQYFIYTSIILIVIFAGFWILKSGDFKEDVKRVEYALDFNNKIIKYLKENPSNKTKFTVNDIVKNETPPKWFRLKTVDSSSTRVIKYTICVDFLKSTTSAGTPGLFSLCNTALLSGSLAPDAYDNNQVNYGISKYSLDFHSKGENCYTDSYYDYDSIYDYGKYNNNIYPDSMMDDEFDSYNDTDSTYSPGTVEIR